MQTQTITVVLHSKDKLKLENRKAKPLHKTLAYLLLSILLKSTLTFSAMYIVSAGVIPAAYRFRGYYSFGGEWLIIGATGLFVWFGLSFLLKEDKSCK